MTENRNDKSAGTQSKTYSWETVPVFVSSTFNDMHGERDYLVKEVFPNLRDWCEERKLRLVDIDLRWGVTETDATRNKNVVQVCLDRIDDARPFFLCFLGQRYGWIPKKEEIADKTFSEFSGLENAVDGNASVTEMEILHALLQTPFDKKPGTKIKAEHAFFYLRDDSYLKDIPTDPLPLKRIYADAAEPEVKSRDFLVKKQTALRKRIAEETGRPARPYTGRWNDKAQTPELALPLQCPSSDEENRKRWRKQWKDWAGVDTTEERVTDAHETKAQSFNKKLCAGRLEDFCCEKKSLGDIILDDLKTAILVRYPERKDLPEQDELDKEIDRHENFVRIATDVFIKREGDFAELDAYAIGDSRKPFALTAKAGLGKSTLLANWAAKFRARAEKPANETMHLRFVGVGEHSNSVDALLRSILEELRRNGKLTTETPDNANLLRTKFAELLGECGKTGRTIVVIDALNQLQSGLSDIDWLARDLPPNVKLIVSFKSGDDKADNLAEQLGATKVKPFGELQHRRDLVAAYLKQFLKELDPPHIEALINAEGAENPLFLKVVLTELKVFGAFAQLGEVIKNRFGNTPESAFNEVLRRLEDDPSYAAIPSKQAVPLLFGLLAHSRGGLPEDLLVRMFLDDLKLDEKQSDDVRSTVRLFLRQVRPFLARREGRTDFFYEAFLIAAKRRYAEANNETPREWHARLSGVCEKWNDLHGAAKRYALGNLPHHEIESGNPTAAADAMTDFGYHYVRLEQLGASTVIKVTMDFAVLTVCSEVRKDRREKVVKWKVFYAEIAHFLKRQGIRPETEFQQRAVANADDSPVTQSAEAWIDQNGSKHWWFRKLRRPYKVVQSACLRVLEGHTGSITSVVLHADGRHAVTGSSDDTVRVWNLDTGECLRTLKGHSDCVNSVMIHSDGQLVVSAGRDYSIRVWELDTGRCIKIIKNPLMETPFLTFSSVALHQDGRRAVTGSQDDYVRVWDLETGVCLKTLVGHSNSVDSVALHQDGKRLLTGSQDNDVMVWDMETGKCLQVLRGHTDAVSSVTLQADGGGRIALSGSWDCTARAWDLKTGACLHVLEGNSTAVRSVALSEDGLRALTGSDNGLMCIWNLETGVCHRTLKAHDEAITSVAFHVDGRRAVSASDDKTVRFWDLEAYVGEGLPNDHTSGICALSMHADGWRVATGSYDTTARVWDLKTSECLQMLKGHRSDVCGVALHQDGLRVITMATYPESSLRVWNIETGECLRTMKSDSEVFTALVLHADGRRAVTGHNVGTVRVWDLETGQCLKTLEGHTKYVTSVALHLDERRAVTGSDDKTLRLWDLETSVCLQVFEGHTECISSIDLHANGLAVVSASNDGTIRVWDIITGACSKVLKGHTGWVEEVVLQLDSSRAMTRSWDFKRNSVQVWDLEMGACLKAFDGGARFAFPPDGRRMATAGGELRVWDLETDECLGAWLGVSSFVKLAMATPVGNRNARIVAGCHDGSVHFFELMPPGTVPRKIFNRGGVEQ